jgi:hypothetical protein
MGMERPAGHDDSQVLFFNGPMTEKRTPPIGLPNPQRYRRRYPADAGHIAFPEISE